MSDSRKNSLGELACLAIVIWQALRGQDVSTLLPALRKRHQEHFDLLIETVKVALKLNGTGKLELPRYLPSRSQVGELGELLKETLNSNNEKSLGSAFALKSSHWRGLALLVVFVSQLKRNEEKCRRGNRVIHVQVHGLAIDQEVVSGEAKRWENILLTFLTRDEVDNIRRCFVQRK